MHALLAVGEGRGKEEGRHEVEGKERNEEVEWVLTDSGEGIGYTKVEMGRMGEGKEGKLKGMCTRLVVPDSGTSAPAKQTNIQTHTHTQSCTHMGSRRRGGGG